MDNQQPVQSTEKTTTQQPTPDQDSQQPTVTPIASQPQEPAKKSSGKAILIGLVILIAIAAVTYIIVGKSSSTKTLKTNGQTINQSISPTLPVTATSTADTQLDKDTQNIDSSIKSLDSDVQNADKGLNDTPVDLSQ